RYCLSRESRASFRSFSSRLKYITMMFTNSAANRVDYQACAMKFADVYICWHQVFEPRAPHPRKLTAASVRMDVAIWSVSRTIMICNTFGKRWRNRILDEEAPIWREAAMNSNSRTFNISPRIILAAPGQENAPITNTTIHNPPVDAGANFSVTWRNTKRSRKNGMTRKTSVTRMRRLSIQFPKYPATRPIVT